MTVLTAPVASTPEAPRSRGTVPTGHRAPRVAWIDMARGACVLAVVLYHVCLFHALAVIGDRGGIGHAWAALDGALTSLRMPLLLLLSGWLAEGKVRSGFTSRTRLSIATNYWLYAVWLTVLAVLNLVTRSHVASSMGSVGDWLVQLVLPLDSGLWFVFALALYVTAMTALRRVPDVVVLLALVSLSCAMGVHGGWYGPMWQRVLMLWFFFAAGVYLKQPLLSAARSTRALPVAVLVAGAAVVLHERLPGIGSHLAFLVMGMGIAIALLGTSRLLGKLSLVRRPMQWIGRRTLGIYVIHMPLVGLLALATAGRTGRLAAAAHANPLLQLVYPVLVTALVVVASLGLEAVLKRCGARDMFRLPEPLARRIGGHTVAPTA